MKHLVVQFLDKGAVALLVFLLIAGFIGGYQAGGFGAALAGLLAIFILAVPFFGGLFLLLEMNESLRAVRKALESRQP